MFIAGAYGERDKARLWKLTDITHPKIYKSTEIINCYTCVDISYDDDLIICHSSNQNPYVFELESTKMIGECVSSSKFTQVEEVVISNNKKLFFSKGYDSSQTPIAVLWCLETRKVIREFTQCSSISFSPNSRCLVTNTIDIQNPSNNKVSIWKIDNNLRINNIDINFNSSENYFLPDSLILSTKIIDQNITNFALTETSTGQMIGEVKYTPENNSYAFIDITTEESGKETNIVLNHTAMA